MGCFTVIKDSSQNTETATSVIPKPVSVKMLKDSVTLQMFSHILIHPDTPETRFIADEIKTLLSPAIDIEIAPNIQKGKGRIELNINSKVSENKEGYNLSIFSKRILIEAPSAAGLFYGFQSLRQLLPPELEKGIEPQSPTIPCVEIEDYPRFGYRGMHLDVSRHFFDVEFIKTYLDMIAIHKMNVFHWHLTDDNGWRIEIDRYPELTEKSAWRVDREHENWKEWSPVQANEKASYGGFYTKDEIREVIQYADDRYITVIPEIEMPGHTSEVFAAYPELSCKGDTLDVVPGSYWPNVDIFCAGNDEVFAFIENVLSEVVELFPGPYIHIGGDEADKTNWKECQKCQNRIRAEDLKDEQELQSWFIQKIEKFLVSKNKKLVGWDEILEGGLADEATVMSWRGTKGGVESARQGHDVIMCPTSHCYFDYYQADPETSPEAIGGFTTLKKVYSFNPVPEELNEEESKYILGAQGNLWTEYVKTNERAQYRTLPRMTALAEVVWSPKNFRDYDDFYGRLVKLQERFDFLDWTYAPGSFIVSIQASPKTDRSTFKIDLSSEKPGNPIHFTVDGTDPSISSPRFQHTISIKKTTPVKAALFIDGKQSGKISKKTFYFHKAVVKPVEYLVSHKRKYSGKGQINLVDGLIGTAHYNDGYWQGWEGDDMDVILDLGERTLISKISAGFLESVGSWIFLPIHIAVSFSIEDKQFKNEKIIQLTEAPPDSPPERRTADFSGISELCRYIRIQAQNRKVCPDWHPGSGGRAWIFSDEIIIE